MRERKSVFTSLEVKLSLRVCSSKFMLFQPEYKIFLSSPSLCLTCQWHYESVLLNNSRTDLYSLTYPEQCNVENSCRSPCRICMHKTHRTQSEIKFFFFWKPKIRENKSLQKGSLIKTSKICYHQNQMFYSIWSFISTHTVPIVGDHLLVGPEVFFKTFRQWSSYRNYCILGYTL